MALRTVRDRHAGLHPLGVSRLGHPCRLVRGHGTPREAILQVAAVLRGRASCPPRLEGGGAEEGRGLSAALERGERPHPPPLAFETLDGDETISLADYRGKAVVLNFWASWCQPCKKEAPMLQETWERYRDEGLVVLGIDAQDFRQDARRFVERYELTYPIAYDGNGKSLGPLR